MAIRRPDIDWLRVLAVYLLFVFHVGKVFDPAPFYHIRNADLSFTMLVVCGFVGLWHMPLFFLLAGWSAVASLQTRALALSSGSGYGSSPFRCSRAPRCWDRRSSTSNCAAGST